MTRAHLKVSEIFGPTFQGEGPSMGQLAMFLRLSRCNLSCTWCDTPYTWDSRRFDLAEETSLLAPAEAVERLRAIDAPVVVVTGGEPLLQQETLGPVLDACYVDGRRVEVETNGALRPNEQILNATTSLNVSPKLANSGLAFRRRIHPTILRELVASGKAIFKFVVERQADLNEIARIEARLGIRPIWVMPQGQTAEEIAGVMRDIADAVLVRGWNLSTRLHITLWGTARGR